MNDDLVFTLLREIFENEISDIPVFLNGEHDGVFILGFYWDSAAPIPLEHGERMEQAILHRISASDNPILRKLRNDTRGFHLDPTITRPRKP